MGGEEKLITYSGGWVGVNGYDNDDSLDKLSCNHELKIVTRSGFAA